MLNNLKIDESICFKQTHLSTHETGFFSWANAQRFFNAMPAGITPCRTVREAKIYTVVLLAVLSVFVLPLLFPTLYLYLSIKKGGNK